MNQEQMLASMQVLSPGFIRLSWQVFIIPCRATCSSIVKYGSLSVTGKRSAIEAGRPCGRGLKYRWNAGPQAPNNLVESEAYRRVVGPHVWTMFAGAGTLHLSGSGRFVVDRHIIEKCNFGTTPLACRDRPMPLGSHNIGLSVMDPMRYPRRLKEPFC